MIETCFSVRGGGQHENGRSSTRVRSNRMCGSKSVASSGSSQRFMTKYVDASLQLIKMCQGDSNNVALLSFHLKESNTLIMAHTVVGIR